jgi:hypothetical protein
MSVILNRGDPDEMGGAESASSRMPQRNRLPLLHSIIRLRIMALNSGTKESVFVKAN